jgi:glycosyltransferase involved in cell wall biosynthesis
MNNSILYISYDGLTDSLGQSQILPYIIGLSKQGYRFTIVSAEKEKVYACGKDEIQKICKENNIDWQPIKYTKKPPILSTIKDIKKIEKLAFKLHRQKQFKAVHCRSYISAIVGQKMQKKLGLKFIFDMRGFWADERIDGKIWDLNKQHYRLIYKYFKKKEKEFLQDADAIVSLTHSAKDILQNKWNVKKPIYVIPCTVDTDLFKPKNNENLQLTLGYLGSIGTWYMLDEMLDFFKVLLEKYPTAKFKFITNENPDFILSKATKKGLEKKYFDIAAAKRQEVPTELAKIDIGIFFIKPVFSKQASSPVKQGEFMAMGIPVITNSGIGDTDSVIQRYNSGILINDFTLSDYRKAVREIEKLRTASKINLLKGASEYFSLEYGVETYNTVYAKIFN